MSIVICQVNSKFVHASLAAWYLKAGLTQYGVAIPAKVIEPTVNQPFDDSLAMVMEESPRYVALCCYIWNVDYALHLAQALKAYDPTMQIVVGGPEASFRAEELMHSSPYLDGVLSGAGEYSFSQWIRANQGEATFAEVPGLTYRQDGQVVSTPQKPLPLPPPDPFLPEYFEQLNGRMAYIETSRGCPFSCAFCLSGGREPVAFFDLDQAKANLLRLADCGVKTVKLVDRTFNCNPSRAKELVRFLTAKRLDNVFQDVCFHLEVGADLFDDEFIELFNQAPIGLFQIEAGVQSFYAPALEACQRKTDMAKLTKNLQGLLKPNNVHVHMDLIAGLPYENFDTFTKSFDQAFALRPHMLQLGFLKLLPGSALREKQADYGYRFDPKTPYEILESTWITYPELRKLKRAEAALDAIYNSGRFLNTLDTVLKITKISPYALFQMLGDEKAKSAGSFSPAHWANLCLNLLPALPGMCKELVRDILCEDWLAAACGALPPCLKQPDTAYFPTFNKIKVDYPVGTNLQLAFLYHGTYRAVMAGASPVHPITRRRQLFYFSVPGGEALESST